MCFSAAASFAGAAVLFCLGLVICIANKKSVELLEYKYSHIQATQATLEDLHKNEWFWWPALTTPILFALQQASEGVVWLAIARGRDSHPSGYVFCVFAFCLWPVWVPLVCLVLELRVKTERSLAAGRVGSRILLLVACLVLGALVSLYTLMSLFTSSLTFASKNDHVVYHFSLIDLGGDSSVVLLLPYMFCTLVPFTLVQCVPYLWVMTLYVGAAAGISFILFSDGAFASTWCFFAAWLSVVIGFVRKRDGELTFKNTLGTEERTIGPESTMDTEDDRSGIFYEI